MAFDPSNPIVGTAQIGFTSPTYPWVMDTAPDSNGEQRAIATPGGTQAGVTAHSISSPFTITAFRPKRYKRLGQVNPVTGQIGSVPRNVSKVITRKGVTVLSGQPPQVMLIETIFHVPAGAELTDAPNVLAACSAHFGVLNNTSSGLGTLLQDGVL
jgi:hypothetical protein